MRGSEPGARHGRSAVPCSRARTSGKDNRSRAALRQRRHPYRRQHQQTRSRPALSFDRRSTRVARASCASRLPPGAATTTGGDGRRRCRAARAGGQRATRSRGGHGPRSAFSSRRRAGRCADAVRRRWPTARSSWPARAGRRGSPRAVSSQRPGWRQRSRSTRIVSCCVPIISRIASLTGRCSQRSRCSASSSGRTWAVP